MRQRAGISGSVMLPGNRASEDVNIVIGESVTGPAGRLVLLCEGNPDPRWQKPFTRLCLDLRAEFGEQAVTLAFLAHAEPSLLAVASQAAADGMNTLTVLPMLLSVDEALEQEIPRQLAQVKQALPGLEPLLLPPLGEYPLVADAVRMVAKTVYENPAGQSSPHPRQRFVLLSTTPGKQKPKRRD